MNHVPAWWAAAHAPHQPAPVRIAARQLIRLRRFMRALAQADHTPFGGYY